jgi:hypothetical protein
MNDRVRVIISDDVDYEDLIAEIQVDGDCVAILSQEKGDLQLEIDHSWVWSKGRRKELALSEFKRALEQAETSLRKMKKE